LNAIGDGDSRGNLTNFDSHSSLVRHGAESNRVQERKYENRIGLLAARTCGRYIHHTRTPRPAEINWLHIAVRIALSFMLLGNLMAPFAPGLRTLEQATVRQAVQGQQATTVEGTVSYRQLGCNVIAPVIAVACLALPVGTQERSRLHGLGVTALL